ncbi:MAG: hypothetical protein E6G00_01165 [Actinobacteria bacterium]|nr:MAG: hypothetical protein E6G29_01660 [Actinomycetota bacterium]TMM13974.1 MAG: hypothetical protein E6G00_01165 [Actinomycetota bacterium]
MKRCVAVLAALACVALVPATEADNSQTGNHQQELGSYSDTPFPAASCPADCQAMAQVTGVQMQIGSHHSPFRVKRPGNIVAFTIRLANPSADQINYFKTTFGAKKTPRDGLTPGGDDAQVRLSVLKPLHTKQRFLLENQSETFDVEQYLGSTVTFALAKALRIHKDRLLALTVPTWVPAFAHSLDTNEAWRASHRSDECTQKNPHPRPHTKMGTFMQYGCFYRTARVLYSATFVPDAAKTSPPAK